MHSLSTVGARRKKRHANKLTHGKNDWSQGIVVRIEIREPRGGTPARRRLGDAGAALAAPATNKDRAFVEYKLYDAMNAVVRNGSGRSRSRQT